jgi:hypothetical protein
MVSLISRFVGAIVVLGFAVIGAGSVLGRIFTWKDAHDKHYATAHPPVVR